MSAVAFNPSNPQKRERVCVILDTGSQRSYITVRMRVNFSLHSWGQKDLSILMFGSTKKQVQSCQLVKVGLETNTGESLEVRLLSVPHICEPLSSSVVDVEKYFGF